MHHNKSPSVGCIIITHHAKQHLAHCLPPLLTSPLKPRILVVNSSSHDGTLEMAQKYNVETVVIPRNEFNHGVTREKARKILGTDLVVMLTPDAYLSGPDTLETLLRPILNRNAEVAYARQIPHLGTKCFFASFTRQFNYGEQSHIRSLQDLEKYGIYTFFCSNSCAAYSNAMLDEIGGFQSVLVGEDTVAVAKALRKGFRIAYVAEAVVYHSHAYTLKEEFLRNFDNGLARKTYEELLKCTGSDIKRGREYFYKMSRQLLLESPHLLPYAIAHLGAKWLGYQIGKRSGHAPLWWKKALSSQDYYWNR
jgi:rhamnosyltransferase